jgi:hypothetical protein
MDSPAFRRHWPLAAVAVLFGLYGWALVVTTAIGHDGAIGPRFNALGADWVIFMTAARAFFTGDLAQIYNQAWITQATNGQYADWLSAPLLFPLFPYPPVFLLLVLPFAKLPPAGRCCSANRRNSRCSPGPCAGWRPTSPIFSF